MYFKIKVYYLYYLCYGWFCITNVPAITGCCTTEASHVTGSSDRITLQHVPHLCLNHYHVITVNRGINPGKAVEDCIRKRAEKGGWTSEYMIRVDWIQKNSWFKYEGFQKWKYTYGQSPPNVFLDPDVKWNWMELHRSKTSHQRTKRPITWYSLANIITKYISIVF